MHALWRSLSLLEHLSGILTLPLSQMSIALFVPQSCFARNSVEPIRMSLPSKHALAPSESAGLLLLAFLLLQST